MINNLNRETNDGQTFTEFRSAVETEKEKQEEFWNSAYDWRQVDHEIRIRGGDQALPVLDSGIHQCHLIP